MEEAVGIALNGVLIKPAAHADGYDVIFPRVRSGAQPSRIELDQCLGTTKATFTGSDQADGAEDLDTDGVYHYHTMSPCIFESDATHELFSCADIPACKKSPTLYYSTFVSDSSKEIYPVGIAKDGRLIYGPYTTSGLPWGTCDVDFCNGRWIQGYYSYVMTEFFPYTVGCWGQG